MAREGDSKRNVSPVWLWVTPPLMRTHGIPMARGGCECITGNGICLGTVATSSWTPSYQSFGASVGAPSECRVSSDLAEVRKDQLFIPFGVSSERSLAFSHSFVRVLGVSTRG